MFARVKSTSCVSSRAVTAREALNWGEQWIQAIAPHTDAPCAFFDIDFTLIDAMGKPILETVGLLKKCEALGVQVFYITARPESGRSETLRALRAIDLQPRSSSLAMFPPELEVTYESIGRMKRKHRARYAQQMTPILNVGDAFTDGGSDSQLQTLTGVNQDDPKMTGIFWLQPYPFIKLPTRAIE